MVTKTVKSYALPHELARRVERLATERYAGNRSAAAADLFREALPVLETLPEEATKTT